MGERWRLATEHRKPIAFLVTWITGLHDVQVHPSGIDCIDCVAILFFFKCTRYSQRKMSLSVEDRFDRLAHLLCSKSPQIADSAKREISKILNKDNDSAFTIIQIIQKWTVSSVWEERITSAILLELILRHQPKEWCHCLHSSNKSFQITHLTKKSIRSLQKWLTSDQAVEYLDKTMSLSQLQKKLKAVIKEEIEENDETDIALENADSILCTNPGSSLICDKDVESKKGKIILNKPIHSTENWVTQIIQTEFQFVSTPLIQLFIDTLPKCIHNSWEVRHGACILLNTFISHSSFEYSIHLCLLYILLITLFSDYFLDASNAQITLPVHEVIVESIACLLKKEPSFAELLHTLIASIGPSKTDNSFETWIWNYNVATLLNQIKTVSIQEERMLAQWFDMNDYLTQRIILQLLAELPPTRCELLTTQVLERILSNCVATDYMTEWCCCLDLYVAFLTSHLDQLPPMSLQKILTYYLSILLPSTTYSISNNVLKQLLLYFIVLIHHSSPAVRQEAYGLIENGVAKIMWNKDDCLTPYLLLLLDAISRETTLQTVALQCYLIFISSIKDQSQTFQTLLQAEIHNVVLFQVPWIIFHPSQQVIPFSSSDDLYWCFYWDYDQLDRNVLFIAYSCLCTCCNAYLPMKTQEELCLLTLLQDSHTLTNILHHYNTVLPPQYPLSSVNTLYSKYASTIQEKTRIKLHDPRLDEELDAICKLTKTSKILQFFDANVLKQEKREKVEEIISAENNKYRKEDDLIYFILLNRRIDSYYQILENLKKEESTSALINWYLSQLIEYKRSHTKEILKILLSQFHHVLPLCPYDQVPLLCMIVCSSLPIESDVIFQRVLRNICRLSLRDPCYVIIEILFSALHEKSIFESGTSQLKELIQLGLNGNEQDKKKSLLLLQTLLHISKDHVSLIPFLIQTVDTLISTTILNETEVLDQYCCILMQQNPTIIHQVCIYCMENLQGSSEQQAYNNVYVLIQLTQKDSLVLLSFQYHLLNRITKDLSIFNANHHVHSLLLRFYSNLIQFIDLEPVFLEDEWLKQYWNQKKDEIKIEKKRYNQFCHQYDEFVLPFTPLKPLRQYQIDGVRWLLQNCMTQLASGGVLADEMGLGKTAQIAVALESSSYDLPNCIVVPKSILMNWKKEIELFIPSECVSLFVFTPTAQTFDNRMYELQREISEAKEEKKCCIVLTSYSSVRNQFGRQSPFFQTHFHCCVLDEGHFIRNSASQLHRAVCAIQSNHRIVLSGTPIQNYLDDIIGIFDFIAPHFFSSYDEFYERYVRPIMLSYRSKQRSVLMKASERIEELTLLIAPFILRRTKKEVSLEIPQLSMQDIECPLTDIQHTILNQYRNWHNQQSQSNQLIQNIINCCTHPSLLPVDEFVSGTVLNSLHSYLASGKFILLKLLIERILQIGEYKADIPTNRVPKIVIFSQKPVTLSLIESQILMHYKDTHYCTLKSEQSPERRMELINMFQSNPSIQILLSTTGIGGHGFTLTAAQSVILVEHNMNPFVDYQAIDRCHRIGQKEFVNVYRLISDEPNESRIMNLQRFKEYIATTVIENDKEVSAKGALNEIKSEEIKGFVNTKIVDSLREIEEKKRKREEPSIHEEKRICLDDEEGFELYS